MRVEYNKTGAERKELIAAIEKITGIKPKYQGVRTMAYTIGGFTLTREGALESEDSEALEELVESLSFEGFISADMAAEMPDTEETQEVNMELCIEVPREKLTDEAIENIKRIVESKQSLLKKAFRADELPVLVADEKVSFPWFDENDAESVKAYTRFIEAICHMAINQKRITAKEKEVDNEKYAFRCFLLRLGFIGNEYKQDRKILLRNLSGSSAFKSGAKEAS